MVTVAAFGALNQDSYDVFSAFLRTYAQEGGIALVLSSAAPYPNARGVSEADRPLRAEALADEAKRARLYAAVAGDARLAGADTADIAVMPCMSMIGFHDGIEAALGRAIVRLDDVLQTAYRGIGRVGVLHMRPAKNNVVRIFGDRLVVPDAAEAAQLLAAEDAAKQSGTSAPVEAVMKTITATWRDRGVGHVLFARADAPRAIVNETARVAGVTINSVFDLLAAHVVKKAR